MRGNTETDNAGWLDDEVVSAGLPTSASRVGCAVSDVLIAPSSQRVERPL